MNEASAEQSPVELLAEEFLDRQQRGEKPAIGEYCERHPELADEIRDVFEGLAMLEDLKPDSQDRSVLGDGIGLDGKRLERIGDYRILQEIGRGGMGVVYEAEQESLGRRVALKVLPRSAAGDTKAVERFQREARAAARMHHTNIVPVFDVGQDDQRLYYAMQLIQGQGLDRVVDDLQRLREQSLMHSKSETRPAPVIAESLLTGRFHQDNLGQGNSGNSPNGSSSSDGVETTAFEPVSTSSAVLPGHSELSSAENNRPAYYRSVAQIGLQTASALSYAHARGIIHRDIKPSNLLLDAAGVVWVTDFGLAKTGDSALTHTGDILGTIRYMSPERFRGRCDVRADLYSLGLTLYELVNLKPAFATSDRLQLIEMIRHSEPASLRSVDRRIPRDLETIILKSIDKDPKRRYQSADNLAEDLRRFVDDEPIAARRISAFERLGRWAKRHKAVSSLAAAIALFLVIAAVTATLAAVHFGQLAESIRNLAAEKQSERDKAQSALYKSLIEQMKATRLARETGYRAKNFALIRQALALKLPEVDRDELRREAVACMGDFVGLKPRTFRDFSSNIVALAAHPVDGKVAVAMEEGTISLRDAHNGKEITFLKGPLKLRALEFDANRNRLYAAGLERTIVWEQDKNGTWSQIKDWSLKWMQNCALTDRGMLGVTLSATDENRIEVWDLDSGTCRNKLRVESRLPPYDRITCEVNPNGTQLVIALQSRPWIAERFLVCDLTTGKPTGNPIAPQLHRIRSLRYSRDGRFLACVSTQGITVYSTADRRQRQYVRVFHQRPYQQCQKRVIAFTPDGSYLVVPVIQQNAVEVWNHIANRQNAVLGVPGHVCNIDFAERGKVLALVGKDFLQLHPYADAGERLGLFGHEGGVPGVTFRPDGKELASIGKDRTVKFWDPDNGKLLRELQGLPGLGQVVTYSPNGELIATGDYEKGSLWVWNAKSGKLLTKLDTGFRVITQGIAFSRDGRFLAAAGKPGGVVLWKVDRQSEMGETQVRLTLIKRWHKTSLASYVCFSSNSRWMSWTLLTPGRGREWIRRQAFLWEVGAEQEPWAVPTQIINHIKSLAFSPDSRQLIFINHKHKAEIWDVVEKKKVRSFPTVDLERDPDPSKTVHVALSSDGKQFAASSASSRGVNIWDTKTGKLLLALPERSGTVWWLDWSPDGNRLAVSRSDGDVGIWNIRPIYEALTRLGLQP